MDSTRASFFAIAGFFFGIWSFWKGFQSFQKKRLLENIPTSKIRSMAMGQVEISGTAVDWVTLEAPFSQEPCVYCEYTIESYEKGEKRSYWKRIYRESSELSPFYIEDQTGRSLVYPHGASVQIPYDYRYITTEFSGVPMHLVEFMDRRRVNAYGFMGIRKKLRFTEYRITPGDTVYILGSCQDNRENLGARYELRVRELLEQIKENPEFLQKADTDRDGDISPKEWGHAIELVKKQALKEQAKLPQDKVYIGAGDTAKELFIISDRSEKSLISSLLFGTIAGIFGGSSLTVFCLWYLLR